MNTALDNVMAQAEAAAAAHQVPEVPAYQPPALQQPGGVPAKRTLQSVNDNAGIVVDRRSEEHTSELQSLMRISYAVFCLKKKNNRIKIHRQTQNKKNIKEIL